MIEVRDLSFSYREYSGSQRLRPILSALDLTVKKGERMLILGPPDSGKSTLSRILCALVPRHAEGELSGV
ncbi:MAG: ATP-binding cassette domain-containing protein, partial [Sphaerochaetaceae bacterium]